MKKLLTLMLILGIQSVLLAQTKKPATPAKKTTTTKPATAAKPATTPAVATPATAPAPAATTPAPAATTPAPTSTAEEQQRQQELYDKLHGNNQKTTAPTPNSKTKTSSSTPTKPQAATRQEMSRPTEYSSSQSKDNSKFRIGVRGGVNFSTFAEAGQLTAEGVESVMGFHGGVVFNIGGKTLSVQPEILFSQVGLKGSQTSQGSSIAIQSVVNTIQVPVLLKLAVGGGGFRFFVNGGGYGSYGLSGSVKTTINGSTTTQKVDFDSNEGRLEYGVVGGAGLQFGLGKAQLLLEGRYNYGLGNNEPNADIFSRTIMGSVGVLIPL